MKKVKIILLLVLFIFTMGPTVKAEQIKPQTLLQEAPNRLEYPDREMVIWKQEKTFDYTSLPYKKYHTMLIKIFNQRGVQQCAEIPIYFHEKWNRLKINTAKVITPEGKVIPIKKENIKDQTIDAKIKSNIYSSRKKRTIFPPGLEPGAIIVLKWTKEIKRSLIKDEIQFFSIFNSHQSKLKVIVPREKKLNYRVKPLKGLNGPKVKEKEDSKIYIWKGYKTNKIKQDYNFAPQVLASTLSSWTEYSKWYNSLITDQYKLNRELKEKVKELTADAKTEEEKIKALYNYTATNIRYVGMTFGINGWRPYSANRVYENKFGVCKEKACFLIALLKEIGIEAHPVVINTSRDPDLEIVVNQFNHMIVYLPEQDKYLDPTSGIVRYGNLSLGDQGKRVVDLTAGKIRKTPILPLETNQEIIKEEIKLSQTGDARFNLKWETKGYHDVVIKSIFRVYNTAQLERNLEKIISNTGTSLKITNSRFKGTIGLERTSDIKLVGQLSKYSSVMGDMISCKPFWLPQDIAITLVGGENWVIPKKCTRNIVLDIPSNYRVKYLPEDINVENNEGKLKVNYKQEGDKIVINYCLQYNKLEGQQNVGGEVKDIFNRLKQLKEQQILLEK